MNAVASQFDDRGQFLIRLVAGFYLLCLGGALAFCGISAVAIGLPDVGAALSMAVFTVVFVPVGVTIAVCIYFAPAMVAYYRYHLNTVPILLVNTVFGAMFFGWFIAMVWALTSNVHPSRVV